MAGCQVINETQRDSTLTARWNKTGTTAPHFRELETQFAAITRDEFIILVMPSAV